MTQCEKVLKHMREHGSISTIEAFTEYGITRLSARVWDLRNDGVEIESEMVTKKRGGTTVTYAVYKLA